MINITLVFDFIKICLLVYIVFLLSRDKRKKIKKILDRLSRDQ